MAFDRRIQLQRAGVETNAANEDVPVWAPLGPARWAEETPLSDGERIRAQGVGAAVTTRWRVRWCQVLADLSPADQLVEVPRGPDAPVVHGITGVKKAGGRRQFLEITSGALTPQPKVM